MQPGDASGARVPAARYYSRLAHNKLIFRRVSTRILGRRTAPFPPLLISYRVPHGFTQDPSTVTVLGSWVGGRRLFHLYLILTASRMVLPKILVLHHSRLVRTTSLSFDGCLSLGAHRNDFGGAIHHVRTGCVILTANKSLAIGQVYRHVRGFAHVPLKRLEKPNFILPVSTHSFRGTASIRPISMETRSLCLFVWGRKAIRQCPQIAAARVSA